VHRAGIEQRWLVATMVTGRMVSSPLARRSKGLTVGALALPCRLTSLPEIQHRRAAMDLCASVALPCDAQGIAAHRLMMAKVF